MNMRDLCLMNADKTDISNTTGPGIKRPVLYFQGKTNWKANSAGDLHAIKQRSAGTAGKQKQKNQGYLENTKSLSNGSAITPTRAQKVTTGKEPQRRICWRTRESQSPAGDPSKHCYGNGSNITPLGNNPLREQRSPG